MSVDARKAQEGRPSWHRPPPTTLVEHSRRAWRWLLSGLAVVLVVLGVYWAWPRPAAQTLLLILRDDRAERNILPPVPSLEADLEALWEWARAARMPVAELPLSRLDTPQTLAQWLSPADAHAPLRFARHRGTPGEVPLTPRDTLIVYVKAHGIALRPAASDPPQLVPLLLKTLVEEDLASDWSQSPAKVLPVGPLFTALASVPAQRKLLILDALHLGHDPRLGAVTNLFPQAVAQTAASTLATRRDLWVVVPGAGGEVSCASPDNGRSVWMEAMLTALSPSKPTGSLPLDQWLPMAHRLWQQRLVAGQTVESQPPELVFRGEGLNVFQIPAMPPSEPPQPSSLAKKAEDVGKQTAQAATSTAEQALSSAVGGNVPAAARSVQQVAGGPGSASASASGSKGAPSSPPGVVNDTSTEKQKSSGTELAADPPKHAETPPSQVPSVRGPQKGSPSAPSGSDSASGAATAAHAAVEELDVVWQIRDRLMGRWSQGLSPICFAPDAWRRVEGILIGFEQRLFCNQATPGDTATLHELRLDLERLEALLAGDRTARPVGPCLSIAEAWESFHQDNVMRSFQGREGSGLDTANRALWTALHAAYRLPDYVRLACTTAMLVDGGPPLSEPLDQLLRALGTLRALLRPEGLPEGRLTETRVRELAQAAEAAESYVRQLEEILVREAERTAREPLGCGRWLRSYLLLQSPLLTAADRPALRQLAPFTGKERPLPVAAPPLATPAQRLAQHKRALSHAAGMLRVMMPADAVSEAARQFAPSLQVLAEEAEALARRLETVPPQADPAAWAELGEQWERVARQLPRRLHEVATALAAPASSEADPPSARLEPFWPVLLVDGRDAAAWRRGLTRPLLPVQPLRPQPLADRIVLTTSASDPTWLALPQSAGTAWQLTLDLTTEAAPPHTVALEMAWNPGDLDLVWDQTGQPVRPGATPLTLTSTREVLSLRAIPRRVETDPAAASTQVTATARFGQASPAQVVSTFLLPRPDRLELVIARPAESPQPTYAWEPQGELGGRVLLFPNRNRRLGLWVRNLSSEEKRLVAQLYRVPAGLAGPGGRLFDPRGGGRLVPSLAELHTQLVRGEGPLPSALRGMLLAQTNLQEPLVFPSLGSRLVPLPLAAAGASPPAAAGPGPSPAAPASGTPSAPDVTSGLLLLLTSPDGRHRPSAHWIELTVPDPDDWLAAEPPVLSEGTLRWQVGLKAPPLAAELGLESQPLSLVWDRRTLPDDVRERGPLERQVTADGRPAVFTASLPPTLRWPLFLALHVDGYPRALLLRLDRTLDQLSMTNWKQNRPAALAITGLRATAGRPGPQARTVACAYWPSQPWLPLPAAPLGEGVVLRPAGTPLAVRIEEDAPQVRLEVDLGAEIAPRYFATGCQVRLEAAGLVQELATARNVRVGWVGVSDGAIELSSEVGDWQRLALGPWDVPTDQQIEILARVVGEGGGPPPLPASDDRALVILDRTAPAVRQLAAEVVPVPLAAAPPSKPRVRFRCRADDGLGSGIEHVEFVAGFDALLKNSRLDPDERIGEPLVVPAAAAQDGWYEAVLELPGEVPSEPLLVEARALDRVGFASRTERTSLVVRKPTGGDRATFGGQSSEKKGPASKKSP